MSRRLDFNHDFRRRQARYGLSLKDEADWLKNDVAARWLQRNKNRASRKADRCASEPQPVSQVKASPRKSRKRSHADLDPSDPHDQVAGVEMGQLPWGCHGEAGCAPMWFSPDLPLNLVLIRDCDQPGQ